MSYDLSRLRRSAKTLRHDWAAAAPDAVARVRRAFPTKALDSPLVHADALHVLAREAGFASWPRLKAAAEVAAMDRTARAEALKRALFLGNQRQLDALLAADGDLAHGNFGLVCALYDVAGVRAWLARDPAAATRIVGVRRPILHLAFSRYHQMGGATEDALAVAGALVTAGADVNDGYPAEPDSAHLLSVLYGAIGHAGNLPLARWLLENGADPNDNESLYHATELPTADGVRLLLAHGADPAGTNALPRAMDFDNVEMVRMLLEAGADPNEGIAQPGEDLPMVLVPGLHQAARRMCSAEVAEALLAHGADGTVPFNGHTAYALARMRGNTAVAEIMERAGQATPLDPTEALLARAADGPVNARIDPDALTDETRRILTRIVGFRGRLAHVKRLVGIGIDPDWTDEQGMTALHIAGWEGQADLTEYLLSLGPNLNHVNAYGGTLFSTVLHGSENCPARAERDHVACMRLVLAAGATVPRPAIEGAVDPEMADFLADWSQSHPEKVTEGGVW